VPAERRTDRLSAACRNRNGSFSADFTPRYHALCSHYGLAYSRNNLGVAHENGRVESPHGHLKRRIEQALLLRGSSDFDTLTDYQTFLPGVIDQYNRPRQGRLEHEQAALRPLPSFRFADYDIEQLTVRRTSTIEVRRVVYSVPPRLIGRQLTCELERLERHGRAWSIDLEHLIDALRRKPRALLHCRYQQELFPDERWWQLWQQLRHGGDGDAAARLMVEALYVGCRLAGYEPVLAWLQKAHHRQELSLAALQQRFRLPPHRPLPTQRIPQHTLQSYDDLLVLRPQGPGGGAALPILLRLARIRSHWQSIASQAEAEGWSHSQFLYALCEQELEALSRQSDWLQRAENVVLFGPSGVGKTHLAISIVLAQIGLDQPCRFYPAMTLVQELQKARADYNLPQALERLDRYPLAD